MHFWIQSTRSLTKKSALWKFIFIFFYSYQEDNRDLSLYKWKSLVVFIFTFCHLAGIMICHNHSIFAILQQHPQLSIWFGPNVVVSQHRQLRQPRVNRIHSKLLVGMISCTGILWTLELVLMGYTLMFIWSRGPFLLEFWVSAIHRMR